MEKESTILCMNGLSKLEQGKETVRHNHWDSIRCTKLSWKLKGNNPQTTNINVNGNSSLISSHFVVIPPYSRNVLIHKGNI